ncbi:MAG: hypothetical protein L0Z51_03805 [Candidatus Latescibacteria bacterium]|nr:hypothetical protein [Candidatus Latescibacterota bacterium]
MAYSLSAEAFREILKCDLVVRGKVQSVAIFSERIVDVAPFLGTKNPELEMRVARIQFTVEEVLRGIAPTNPLEFIAYVDLSHMGDNYDVGQEMVIGLMWKADVLKGVYSIATDSRRFLRTPRGWEQQEGVMLLPDLVELRSVLNRVAPNQVLADADAVVVATFAHEALEYLRTPEGVEYGLKTYHLRDVDVLKGDPVSEVKALTGGDYWPDWRDDPTYPRNLEPGKRYCFFLRRTEHDWFAVLRGMSGVYEISGDALLLPGRKSVGLRMSDVRAYVEAQ